MGAANAARDCFLRRLPPSAQSLRFLGSNSVAGISGLGGAAALRRRSVVSWRLRARDHLADLVGQDLVGHPDLVDPGLRCVRSTAATYHQDTLNLCQAGRHKAFCSAGRERGFEAMCLCRRLSGARGASALRPERSLPYGRRDDGRPEAASLAAATPTTAHSAQRSLSSSTSSHPPLPS